MFQRLSKVREFLLTGGTSLQVQPDLTDVHIYICFPHFPPSMHFFSCLFRSFSPFHASVKRGIQDFLWSSGSYKASLEKSPFWRILPCLARAWIQTQGAALEKSGIQNPTVDGPAMGSRWPWAGAWPRSHPEVPSSHHHSDSLGMSPALWVTEDSRHGDTLTFCPHWHFFPFSCPLYNPVPLFPSVPCSDVQPLHFLSPPQYLPCRWTLKTTSQQFTRSFHSDMESKEKSVRILSVKTFWRYPWGDCQEGNTEKLAIDMLLKIHVPLPKPELPFLEDILYLFFKNLGKLWKTSSSRQEARCNLDCETPTRFPVASYATASP